MKATALMLVHRSASSCANAAKHFPRVQDARRAAAPSHFDPGSQTVSTLPHPRLYPNFVISALIALALFSSCREPHARVHILTGEAMGTTYRIKTTEEIDTRQAAIDDMLAGLDRDLSTWRHDSWVTTFNRAPAGTTMALPKSVAELLEKSVVYHAQTDGCFDPTIGTLIRLWGFGAWRDSWQGEPTEAQIAAAREATGFHLMRIDSDQITKLHAAVMLDFSGIAKGYAVDRIGHILHESGYEDFIIEFGGDLLASGNHPDRDGWTVSGPALDQPLALHNEAMATSGSKHQFRSDQSHIIDPRSGMPVPVGPPDFVIAKTCAEADAKATAKLVK